MPGGGSPPASSSSRRPPSHSSIAHRTAKVLPPNNLRRPPRHTQTDSNHSHSDDTNSDATAPLTISTSASAAAAAAAGDSDSATGKAASASSGSVSSEWDKMLLLVVLYTLQGVPLGLCFGSIPFLLQDSNASLTDIGMFGLAAWPFSLKLLWSPLVDSIFHHSFGRRKSWIVPAQLAIGLLLITISFRVDAWLAPPTPNVVALSWVFFILVACAATQDIAVDGWAISLLSKANQSYGATCQSVGQNIGFFVSYTVFLALNNPGFANRFRTVPMETGLVSLSSYLFFWGIFFLCVTTFLCFKSEAPYRAEMTADGQFTDGLKDTYLKMWKLTKLPHMRRLIVILLTHKIAFQASEGLAVLKLTEKGFPKTTMAALAFVMFPLEMLYPIIVGRLAKVYSPTVPFLFGYPFRVLMCLLSTAVVYYFPTLTGADAELPSVYLAQVIGLQVVYDFSMTLMFVSMNAFFSRISDESFGGTYITFLNTMTNLGGTWPKFLIFAAADRLTCKHAPINGALSAATAVAQELSTAADTAASAAHAAAAAAGSLGCAYVAPGSDGFYPLSFFCVAVGVIWFVVAARSVYALDSVDRREWLIKQHDTDSAAKPDSALTQLSSLSSQSPQQPAQTAPLSSA